MPRGATCDFASYSSGLSTRVARDCRLGGDSRANGPRSSCSSEARRGSLTSSENAAPARLRSRPSSGLPPPRIPGITSAPGAPTRAAFKDITNERDSIADEGKLKLGAVDADRSGECNISNESDTHAVVDRHLLPAPVPLPAVAAAPGATTAMESSMSAASTSATTYCYMVSLPSGFPAHGARHRQMARKVKQNKDSTWLVEFEDKQTMDSVKGEWLISADKASIMRADGGDVQAVAEYASEIFDQLFLKEITFMPRADYMDSQTDINARMRAILIDWLIEVHMKYRLRPETLFLTVNILDRYLSCQLVARRSLQLVGVVSMLIASKFEEITPPEVHDFVYITDNAYTKQDILNTECSMLTALGFNVVAPSQLNFLERFQRANGCDGAHRDLVQYIVELALLDIRMIGYVQSHLVAAAMLLSNVLLGRRPAWPASMVQDTRYQETALRACAEELRGLLDAEPSNSLQAVRKKFTLPQHHSVARMTFGSP